MNIFSWPERSRRLLACIIMLVIMSVAVLGRYYKAPGHDPAASLTTTINAEVAKLAGKPRTIELASEKSIRVRDAIEHADYINALRIAAAVLADSRIENWRYYPFNDFIAGITDLNDHNFEAHLNEWVAHAPDNAIPVLIRAQYYYDIGWFRRGHHFARATQSDDMTAFTNYMKQALADVDAAIRLNDGNPYAFHLKLRILTGYGMSQAMANAFAQGSAKYPEYYPLYDVVLTALAPRWGGSPAAMYAFVDRYGGHAAEYSPLRLLYLSLYRQLLDAAYDACNASPRDGDGMAQCVASVTEKTISPQLENGVLSALRLYDHLDRHQFNVAIYPLLLDMLRTPGGDVHAGAIVQLAASATHSDTQLNEDKPGHNNYVIDKAVAESWYVKGFYDNALKKYQEALADARADQFPSEQEKDFAIANIYDCIAATYNKLNQMVDMIAYGKAAVALGGNALNQQFACYGYYQLKDYGGAVRECTAAIADRADNLQAQYWRGMAHQQLGEIDAALQDMTTVANSEADIRTTAAIAMSMIYFNRNDAQGALEVLNRYMYLYDPATDNRTDIAVSYNNRCYAYMQLGKLKNALDDCTASLKFGSLPDAYRKQQELIKRGAGAQQTGL